MDLFSLNTNPDINPDLNLSSKQIRSNYYSPHSFSKVKNNKCISEPCLSFLHNNVRSLKRNLEDFQNHLLHELNLRFNIIGVTETRMTNIGSLNFNPNIPGYKFEYVETPLSAGGVGMYIDETLNYRVIEKNSNEAFQALWIEIDYGNKANAICGVLYRQHNSPASFQNYFDTSLEKFSATGKPIYVLGDFNINLLRFETCKYAHNFLLSLQSYGFVPVIDKPTRVHNNTATLIDNILVNEMNDSVISGNIVSDISDHYSQFCLIPSQKCTLTKSFENKKLRDFSRFSESAFNKDLKETVWESLNKNDSINVNKLFSTFYNKTNKLINKHAPLKTVSKRKTKQLLKPWITKGILKSIRIKNKLFYLGITEEYKAYRNKISTLIRLSKKLYYHNFFSNNMCNMKKTWEGINNLINKKMKCKRIITAVKKPNGNGITKDPAEIPNVFNQHFSSVGQKLASTLPHSKRDFREYLIGPSPSCSFLYDPVTPTEIESEIDLLPTKKTHGLYSFPIRILKDAKPTMSILLTMIMNTSIKTGVYPSKLKHAKIIPVFKNDAEDDPGNYRPISLLSNINRIFEKLMYKRLKSFFEKKNTLCSSQYGFREKHSTQHALLDIVNKIQTNMDKNLFSCGIFIDLQKAFDTVNHSILLHKLRHYGVRGIVNDWFLSYLSHRSQTTQIGTNISSKEKVLCGVPQGSVLGPLLFLIYVNDIHNTSDKFDFFLFADDTNLLYANKNLKSLEIIVNKELESVYEWLTANKLSLNIKKSSYVIFHPYQKKVTRKLNVKVFDHKSYTYISLEQKNYVKYLGILLDGNLSWNSHIDYITVKISKTIGIIARLRHFVPFNTLLNIYRSLIHPYISYGISVWGQAAQKYMNKILILQKRALRLMYFATNREHAIPLFIASNVLPVDMLYYRTVSTLMHDVNNNMAPPNILNLFTSVHSVHPHYTRAATNGKLYCKYSRLKQQTESFSRIGVKIWNEISVNIRKLSKYSFKAKINKMLLQVLEKEDTYANVPTLIKRIKLFRV